MATSVNTKYSTTLRYQEITINPRGTRYGTVVIVQIGQEIGTTYLVEDELLGRELSVDLVTLEDAGRY